MPLIIEIWDDQRSVWKEHGQIVPGERPGSIATFSTILGWEVLLFGCKSDDSCSTIFKSRAGLELDGPNNTRVVSTLPGALAKVAELKDGEAHEITVLTEQLLVPARLRFFHRKIDFGARVCKICNQAIETSQFGSHTMDHGPNDLRNWPGGIPGYLEFLRESLNESIRRAKGFPRIQAPLKASLSNINQMERILKADLN